MKLTHWAAACAAFALLTAATDAADKIVVIAGTPSHGPGDHEFNAGCKLIVKCLQEIDGVEPVFVAGGWPKDESVFEGAKSVVFFMDGGGGHPMIRTPERMEKMRSMMDAGVGLVCLHYAVEVPKGKPGNAFLDWLGGYYESGFSTNPHWVADVKSLPEHPITRGVKPFHVNDEWYFNIRFDEHPQGLTPIIVAKPDDKTRQGVSASPRGPYAHIVAAKGREETLAWAFERPGGGRSFGFTGAHFHKNWGNDDFRKLVLNAILWTAHRDIPSTGTPSTVTPEELKQNLDPKGR